MVLSARVDLSYAFVVLSLMIVHKGANWKVAKTSLAYVKGTVNYGQDVQTKGSYIVNWV